MMMILIKMTGFAKTSVMIEMIKMIEMIEMTGLLIMTPVITVMIVMIVLTDMLYNCFPEIHENHM